MLHLRPRFIGHPLTALTHRPNNPQIAQMTRERGVFDGQAVLFLKFFHDALGVAVALLVKLTQ